ncbi:MAG TPA: sigma-70 family RNA polymerase sigma factor [Rhizomicrobium sp.]|jgi:RNA polymerase sigma-70 factor (ECF subfamily)|nr:sigma-70 family RNA polymerase sigma factor [Rhizomicrobium sp.]
MEQDELYGSAVAAFGPALKRLARVYGADYEDVLQDIHFALWRSLARFNGECSLRTWVYRVAHNTAISSKLRRKKVTLTSLEQLAELPTDQDTEHSVGQAQAIAKIRALIATLKPPDDQVMLLYLEDLDAHSIGEVTGLSPGAVATRIHRIKALLARRFGEGERP